MIIKDYKMMQDDVLLINILITSYRNILVLSNKLYYLLPKKCILNYLSVFTLYIIIYLILKYN